MLRVLPPHPLSPRVLGFLLGVAVAAGMGSVSRADEHCALRVPKRDFACAEAAKSIYLVRIEPSGLGASQSGGPAATQAGPADLAPIHFVVTEVIKGPRIRQGEIKREPPFHGPFTARFYGVVTTNELESTRYSGTGMLALYDGGQVCSFVSPDDVLWSEKDWSEYVAETRAYVTAWRHQSVAGVIRLLDVAKGAQLRAGLELLARVTESQDPGVRDSLGRTMLRRLRRSNIGLDPSDAKEFAKSLGALAQEARQEAQVRGRASPSWTLDVARALADLGRTLPELRSDLFVDLEECYDRWASVWAPRCSPVEPSQQCLETLVDSVRAQR